MLTLNFNEGTGKRMNAAEIVFLTAAVVSIMAGYKSNEDIREDVGIT
jgi:hypothetical protein